MVYWGTQTKVASDVQIIIDTCLLTLPVPIANEERKMWCLKRFYEGLKELHKTFWGTKKCEKFKLIFILIALSEMHWVGRVKCRSLSRSHLKSPCTTVVFSVEGMFFGNHSINCSMAGISSVWLARYCLVHVSVCRFM